MKLDVKELIAKLLNRKWVDISSSFTTTNRVLAFKAVTNGEVVAIQITSRGATDQQNIVTINNSKYYLADGFSYFALPIFYMNGEDFGRNTTATVMRSSIQLRCSSASTGAGGVQIGGVYPINSVVGGVVHKLLNALKTLTLGRGWAV